eukprot:TRINITY_DN45798_c0_g1_i1.p1 TRINITY_DN45798_c0_g1~~TRINITY_DN45798_c0_g1_i1.p1  ORF type:complete len:220 (+),score=33.22 TRINITY_DN45798_c0_g1_i1:16-675(+)
MLRILVGSEMCIRDSTWDLLGEGHGLPIPKAGLDLPPISPVAVTKHSQLGPFAASQQVQLHPTLGMRVVANLTLAYPNVSRSVVNFVYPSMTMFAVKFKRWAGQNVNGSWVSGVFRADDSFTLRQDIRRVAVFDDVGQGVLFQFAGGHVYKGSAGFKNNFWNRAYDHKLYLRIDGPITGVGDMVSIQHSVRGFVAPNTSWVEVASALVTGWNQTGALIS